MTTDTVRLNVCKVENQKKSKLVVVNRNNWNTFLNQASNKLRIKVKRVFTQEGEELSENDLKNAQKVTNNIVLVVTSGTEFHGNKKVFLFVYFSLFISPLLLTLFFCRSQLLIRNTKLLVSLIKTKN
jgi:hypothetical protein